MIRAYAFNLMIVRPTVTFCIQTFNENYLIMSFFKIIQIEYDFSFNLT